MVIDPQRAENVLTNDGSTMRIMVQSMGKPSAWSRQKEIVLDDRDKHIENEAKTIEPDASATATVRSKQSDKQKNSDLQITDDDSDIPGESSGTQQPISVQQENGAATDADIDGAAMNHETEGLEGEDAEGSQAQVPTDEGAHKVPAEANGMKPNGVKGGAAKASGPKSAANEAIAVSSLRISCRFGHS